jgi:hypothetical protein
MTCPPLFECRLAKLELLLCFAKHGLLQHPCRSRVPQN